MTNRRTTRALSTVLIALGALLGATLPASAVPDPGEFGDSWSIELVRENLNLPTSFAFLPDGRILVTEKGGTVQILSADGSSIGGSPYATLSNVVTAGERGLLNIVLDPDFATNNYLYAFVTKNDGGGDTNRIVRLVHTQGGGGVSSSATEDTELWEGDPRTDCCHVGGGLTFGSDGNLYFSTGDDFRAADEVSQDLTSTLGKIHRISPAGAIPAGNPFADGGGPNVDSLWAIGLRNPFRLAWDPVNDRLLAGNVGGNVHSNAFETVLASTSGGENFGWPACGDGPTGREANGDCTDPTYTDPLFAYPHAGTEAAVTGGFVYTDTVYPAALQGVYFFADFTRGFVKYVEFNPDGTAETDDDGFSVVSDDFVSVDDTPADDSDNIVDLKQGPDGALWYLQIAGDFAGSGQENVCSGGCLQRLEFEQGNPAPRITALTATPDEGLSPLTVDFSVSATDEDINGNDTTGTLSYDWDYGDGTSATDVGATPSHTYTSDGLYTARVTIDDGDRTSTDTVEVAVGNAPTVSITNSTPPFSVPTTLNFAVSANDTEDGALSGASVAWEAKIGHDTHAHPLESGTGTSFSVNIADIGHDYFGDVEIDVFVTATDSDGLTATDMISWAPDEVDLTIDTSPAGLVVKLDGTPRNASEAYDSVKGFKHALSVREFQCVGDRLYRFDDWENDSTALDRAIVVPTTNTSYTANFTDFAPCPVLYVRSEDAVTSGDNVVALPDLSGNGNELTIAVDQLSDPISTTPTLVEGGLNGFDVVRFDGVMDGLGRGSFRNGPSGSDERTVIMLASYKSPGFGGLAWGKAVQTTNGQNKAFGLGVASSQGGNTAPLAVQAWGNANDEVSTSEAFNAGFLVQSVVITKSGGNNSGVHYRNGQVIDSFDRPSPYQTQAFKVRLGMDLSDGASAGDFLEMDVVEAIVFDDALSDTDREAFEAYLTGRYLGTDTISPTIDNQSFAVAEGAGNGALVGTVGATDNVGIDTYTITAGDPSDTFAISNNGQLTVADTTGLTAGNDYTLTIEVADLAGNTDTATITIDVVAEPVISVAHTGALEGDSGSTVIEVTVSLSEPSPEPVSVDWEIVSGVRAEPDVDFEADSGTLVFAPGQTQRKIQVTVYGDELDEGAGLGSEWAAVVLSAPVNGEFEPGLFGRLGLVLINDDDPPPVVEPGAAAVLEGDAGSVVLEVPVTLSAPSGLPVTAAWETLATAQPEPGVDFEADSGVVTFAPGDTSATIAITVYGDTVQEPGVFFGSEWIAIRLLSPTNAELPTGPYADIAWGLIRDDD